MDTERKPGLFQTWRTVRYGLAEHSPASWGWRNDQSVCTPSWPVWSAFSILSPCMALSMAEGTDSGRVEQNLMIQESYVASEKLNTKLVEKLLCCLIITVPVLKDLSHTLLGASGNSSYLPYLFSIFSRVSAIHEVFFYSRFFALSLAFHPQIMLWVRSCLL